MAAKKKKMAPGGAGENCAHKKERGSKGTKGPACYDKLF
ncbi:hypothetical protein QG37_01929 [Candidozyma auris]|uniref:Uncharacterized protein n=1 Tax=Candidozyma auris TaxID=498019 RepID=A0A0L0P4W5_CANAR|nr:hypothetical protein QG37_01929 [[Candida] auris]